MKCFADSGIGLKGCSALTKKKCKDCSFFKTKEQKEVSEKWKIDRLKSIGKLAIYKEMYGLGVD